MPLDTTLEPRQKGLIGEVDEDRWFWGILGAVALWKLVAGACLG